MLLPLASAFLAFLLPAKKPGAIRALALFATGVSLLLTLYIFSQFNRQDAGYQFVFTQEWLPSFGITLKFGVDGISMTLLLLGTMLYTALLALAAGRPAEAVGIVLAILPARWISRRIALT